MTAEQDEAALRNEDLAKELFKPWIHALRTMPIEEVLKDPSLRRRRRVRKSKRDS